MKVILLEDIKGVGKKDQIIEAQDGYARNFLFPKKKAVEANNANLAKLKSREDSNNYKKEQEIEAAKALKEKLSKITLVLKVKAGENGKIYGGVTSKEIAETLKSNNNIEIDKKKIKLDEAIKTLGVRNVEVKLYEGIIGTIKVSIED